MSGVQKLELLVVIIKQSRYLDDILAGFMELGIKGATVIDSRGMGQILSADVPIFAGLKGLLPGGNIGSNVVLSVVTEEQVPEAVKLIEETCGGLSEKGNGFLFTVPVNTVSGAFLKTQ
ncbi:MAG: hypothetical protein COX62_01270 [Deltaproteobacteria bacterium CG_4_10_14_0_2_um_filter_43_8]|nr:MAG: hypothetical protein COV43_09410 [Deltaproteobacteria bacterium CG11_big_fil_rev_8_21_14_0_20_42_23]PJA21875.1 MAG: hypothetical protein COX62_01270 [Deltaproteobacteria bacterium CG_4_10_14_0_2_um_filter_43_8]PJC64361.1 MAG: hypothetical protein CO021_04995 [Deltaproteobacteria bacterium CG_4_9_14_0_2_um_filter_42_21]